ncbi:MerR family DNA-binding transcriptional regulator [Halomonas sp. EF61]|uniref:MerR family DNA-binding transcriptional regulator n=1 Tax=Halomonas sp. EF61 TaxID=2950869 RepID=UPI0032DFFBB4
MQTLSIGELAERSGIASQAIRYYEKEKLHKIREQIKHLSQIEAVLSKTLEECTGEGPMQEGCPIVDAIADRDE